jgi:molybdopterin converting factor small subunit
MKVLIPGALRSYTGRSIADAHGTTLGAVLADLDRQYSGIRFRIVDEQERIRRHIRIFVNGTQEHELSRAFTFRPIGISGPMWVWSRRRTKLEVFLTNIRAHDQRFDIMRQGAG